MTCTRCGQQTRNEAPACAVCAALDAALVNGPASGADATVLSGTLAAAGGAAWPGLAAPGGLTASGGLTAPADLMGAGDRAASGPGAGHDRYPGPGAGDLDPATDSWLFELPPAPAGQPEPPARPLTSPAAAADSAPLTPVADGGMLSAAAPGGADFPTVAGAFPPISRAPVDGPGSDSAASRAPACLPDPAANPAPAHLPGSAANASPAYAPGSGSAAGSESPLPAWPGSAAGSEGDVQGEVPAWPAWLAAARHAAPPVPPLPDPATPPVRPAAVPVPEPLAAASPEAAASPVSPGSPVPGSPGPEDRAVPGPRHASPPQGAAPARSPDDAAGPAHRARGGGRRIMLGSAALVMALAAAGAVAVLVTASGPGGSRGQLLTDPGRGSAAAPGARTPAGPSSTGRDGTRRRAGGSVVLVAPAARQQSDARPVSRFLSRYFRAINHHDYPAYLRLFSQASRPALSQSSFLAGYGSTRDSAPRLVALQAAGLRQLAATVTFTSRQDAAASPEHESCLRWRITGLPDPARRPARAVLHRQSPGRLHRPRSRLLTGARIVRSGRPEGAPRQLRSPRSGPG